jgi:hypothetical protein
MSSVVYPSDLSDREWSRLKPMLPPAKPGGRPRSVDLRRILNGIFYLTFRTFWCPLFGISLSPTDPGPFCLGDHSNRVVLNCERLLHAGLCFR